MTLKDDGVGPDHALSVLLAFPFIVSEQEGLSVLLLTIAYVSVSSLDCILIYAFYLLYFLSIEHFSSREKMRN